MTQYEIIITCVALSNLALSLSTLWSARQKATTSRLEAFEREVRDALAKMAGGERLGSFETEARTHMATLDETVHGLVAGAKLAVTHDHLSDVYSAINDLAKQVHTLVGQQSQMNENLRLLLAKLVKN